MPSLESRIAALERSLIGGEIVLTMPNGARKPAIGRWRKKLGRVTTRSTQASKTVCISISNKKEQHQ